MALYSAMWGTMKQANEINFQYSGYFTIHYLYEYVVLFHAGLTSAFTTEF